MIIRYKLDGKGEVVKELLANVKRVRGEDRPVRHFSEQLLKSYYAQECEHGSRFKSVYSKNTIKNVHETAIQRFEQTGADH